MEVNDAKTVTLPLVPSLPLHHLHVPPLSLSLLRRLSLPHRCLALVGRETASRSRQDDKPVDQPATVSANKERKRGKPADDTEVACYKITGTLQRNTHNLLLGLTVVDAWRG
ncbi:solute carrier family 1 member 9 isoform X1 [Lates japonicus]|uniref:Solute carrier family 1 member 9 isoform X1 n=1 Tax=Lates japonicus TaxID=270547 RepID=A0AAD3NLG8_LATJO|nr:solute carrier family 1 member 9 isoform X1 [Lates japonicus]